MSISTDNIWLLVIVELHVIFIHISTSTVYSPASIFYHDKKYVVQWIIIPTIHHWHPEVITLCLWWHLSLPTIWPFSPILWWLINEDMLCQSFSYLTCATSVINFKNIQSTWDPQYMESILDYGGPELMFQVCPVSFCQIMSHLGHDIPATSLPSVSPLPLSTYLRPARASVAPKLPRHDNHSSLQPNS